MNEALIQSIRQRLESAQRILVVSHVRPDGDAVGSLLGLGLALQSTGKDVQMVLSDRVPLSFRHLSGANQVRTRPEGKFDLVAVVDCSDLQRTGDALKEVLCTGDNGSSGNGIPDINIDHHITNLNFASINLVETGAVATSEILAKILPELGLSLTDPVASALLTGIITDTLGFRTSNMTPEVLRVAAKLMDTGADLADLYRNALLGRSFEAARYWGKGLSNLQREGPLVWTTLSLEDRRQAGYPGRDDADLINIVSSIDDADIALVFVEQNPDLVKVSWRAQPGFDVSQIALSFGGGGHKAASGAELQGSLEEVKKKVLEATRTLLYSSLTSSR